MFANIIYPPWSTLQVASLFGFPALEIRMARPSMPERLHLGTIFEGSMTELWFCSPPVRWGPRVVRFHVSCPASFSFFSFSSAGPQLQALDRSVPRRTRTAISGSEWSRRTPTQALDCSGLRWARTASPGSEWSRRTSTASARSQCSPPDPNSKLRIRVILPDLNCKR